MEVVITGDAREFDARTRGFRTEHLDCNLLASVFAGVAGREPGEPPLFAYVVGEDDDVIGAALRTPPWPLLCSALEPAQARALVSKWLERDPRVPGVNAPLASARAVSEAWLQDTGGRARCTMREAFHLCETVIEPPVVAAGSLRPAGERDRALLVEWEAAFVAEAGVPVGDGAEYAIDARLRDARQFVWEDGSVVCSVGCAPRSDAVARLGPVYTPPAQRRRGYGSAAVAELSRRMLEGGAERCGLFTDLANPTSNRIYSAVGYRPVADFELWLFEAPAGGGGSR